MEIPIPLKIDCEKLGQAGDIKKGPNHWKKKTKQLYPTGSMDGMTVYLPVPTYSPFKKKHIHNFVVVNLPFKNTWILWIWKTQIWDWNIRTPTTCHIETQPTTQPAFLAQPAPLMSETVRPASLLKGIGSNHPPIFFWEEVLGAWKKTNGNQFMNI